MKPLALSRVARVTGGKLVGDEATVSGVAVDSREVAPGDLFVALRGERMDGHDFVLESLERGAAGAVVDGPLEGITPLVIVEDTGRALLDLATERATETTATVIGVTGSTGKTSVKDLTAAVLSTRMTVASSPRSFNTEVGVPLTILRAPEDAEAIVCEMGSRGRGHIRRLVEVARPRVGIVTNVGPAHLEMFGSLENVADAKAELVEGLPEDGTAVLNADDPVVRGFGGRTRASPLLYGIAGDADIRGDDLSLDELSRPSFTLRTAQGTERVELATHGEHMASNALAAAAVGIALGLTPGECAAGLKDARLSSWRMEVTVTTKGIRLVNDAYNANPASMGAALRAASWMARGSRAIAVLGEMAELGPTSGQEHERVGELVARLGVAYLLTVGEAASRIAVGATREGVEPDRAIRADTWEEAHEALARILRPGDVVLVKGSRVAGLERLAAALAGEEGPA